MKNKLWDTDHEKKLRGIRIAAIILACLVVSVGLPAARFGPRIYSRVQQIRLVHRARELVAKADYQGAADTLRRALSLNPYNIEASRLMADVADKTGSSSVVDIRRRISGLQPDSFEDAFAWASAALKAGDLDQAASALAIMKRTGPGDARYDETAGRVATALGRGGEANDDFSEALRIAPDDVTYQVRLANNELRSNDTAARERGQKKLEDLSANPTVRLAVLRLLAYDALRRNDINAAIALEQKLIALPEATSRDRLAYLDALHSAKAPLFSSFLAELEVRAKNNPADTTNLLSWMNLHGLAPAASAWIGALPPKMISKPPVADVVAQAYMLLPDWKRLRTFVSAGNWDDSEFIREAFLARALREEGDIRDSASHWETAESLAAERPSRVPMLERIAASWGWETDTEEVVKGGPKVQQTPAAK